MVSARDFYREAYRLTDAVSPLGKADCGRLCAGACCSDNGRNDAGMYLFPHEEVMYAHRPDWIRIEHADFTYGSENRHALIAICKGRCERRSRPLACRIFPLAPCYKAGRRLSVIMDPRAKGMCPLARTLSPEALDGRFVETTAYVLGVLAKNALVAEFMAELSLLLAEYEPFFSR